MPRSTRLFDSLPSSLSAPTAARLPPHERRLLLDMTRSKLAPYLCLPFTNALLLYARFRFGCAPVAARVAKFTPGSSATCPICHYASESHEHLISDCPALDVPRECLRTSLRNTHPACLDQLGPQLFASPPPLSVSKESALAACLFQFCVSVIRIRFAGHLPSFGL